MGPLTVVGGGNGAHALAAFAASKGMEARIWAPIPEEADVLQKGVSDLGGIAAFTGDSVIKGRPTVISANPAEVIPGSELIIFVLPAFAHKEVMLKMRPHLDKTSIIGAMPSRSGFEFMAKTMVSPENIIFGVQTLPWACRIKEYGKTVEILGTKSKVSVAASPAVKVNKVCRNLQDILGIEVVETHTMLALTLGNVGQIIHPGIMYGLFRDWDNKPFAAERIPLFYQGVTEEISGVLEGLSLEILTIKEHLQEKTGVNLEGVLGIKEWLLSSYEDNILDKSTLSGCFNTNRGYKGLKAPVKAVGEEQYVPDFNSRYLTEDVPYGLVVTRGLAEITKTLTPMMDEVITATSRWMGKEYLSEGMFKGKNLSEAPIPQNYGIKTLHDLIRAII